MNASEIKELKRQVASLVWYHSIDLGHDIVTPGYFDHRPFLDYYGLPKDLSGKTALDIGAASGFFSFDLEKRGAKVTATDLPAWMNHDFGPVYQPDKSPDEGRRYLHDPFALAKRVLGSQVEKREINIYDISPQTMGTFDLVFCGSVLLHLTDPIKALWQIASVTREMAIIATVIHQDVDSEPLALFMGHHKTASWWIPNRRCFEIMVQNAGFKSWEWVSEFRLDFRDGRPGLYHGVIRAWNTDRSSPRLTERDDVTIQTPEPPVGLRQSLAVRDAEIMRLQKLVDGYERGRFMRLVKWLSSLRR